MYDFLGICLTLAALLTINAVASILASTVWRFASGFTGFWTAAARARFIFVLRTFPAAAALMAVVVFLIPSYLAYEPRQTAEIVSFKLGLFALFSAIGIAFAGWRGITTWLATKRLISDWRKNAEIICLDNLPIPAYRITHQFPVVAVIGVWHPKLFIAGQIFESLSAEELKAVLAHETGHVAARDNLKHWLMRICRDVLMLVPSSARTLDKDWAEAIELAADEKAAACRNTNSAALDLAQALIKIARLVPAGVKPTMPAGAFLIGDETENGDALTLRIRRLSQLAESDFIIEKDWWERFSCSFLWICFGLLFVAILLAATNSDVLAATHTGIEQLVAFLS